MTDMNCVREPGLAIADLTDLSKGEARGFEVQQMGLGLKATGKSGELTRRSNDPMTWNDNRNWVSAVRGPYRSARCRSPNLTTRLRLF
jgi:hypothetical protein